MKLYDNPVKITITKLRQSSPQLYQLEYKNESYVFTGTVEELLEELGEHLEQMRKG